eukprot:248643_1
MTLLNCLPINLAFMADQPYDILDSSQIEYKDKFCEVTADSLRIYWYYFPFAIAKTIRLTDIRTLKTLNRGEKPSWRARKAWGMSFSNVWWAADCWRIFGKYGSVVIGTGSWPLSGFSCEDSLALARVIEARTDVSRRDLDI